MTVTVDEGVDVSHHPLQSMAQLHRDPFMIAVNNDLGKPSVAVPLLLFEQPACRGSQRLQREHGRLCTLNSQTTALSLTTETQRQKHIRCGRHTVLNI